MWSSYETSYPILGEHGCNLLDHSHYDASAEYVFFNVLLLHF